MDNDTVSAGDGNDVVYGGADRFAPADAAFIQITEQVSSDEFKGTIQVQLNRPVFNASYDSPLLNIKDNDLQFRYVEFQLMEFDETSNSNPLTNILAYYANLNKARFTATCRSFQHHGKLGFISFLENVGFFFDV